MERIAACSGVPLTKEKAEIREDHRNTQRSELPGPCEAITKLIGRIAFSAVLACRHELQATKK
jgi:hypothetical protein